MHGNGAERVIANGPYTRSRRGRILARGVATSLPMLLIAALAANADSIRYSWSGRVEPAVAAGNPWGLTGDGSAVTTSDGTPFVLEAFVDEAAVDEDGTLNPDFAEFATEATLIVGDQRTLLTSPSVSFADDSFGGLFDSVGFRANAELLAATLVFAADVRLPATSFDLASPAAPDPPPAFAQSPPIQFGGSGLPSLVTMPVDLPVSAVLAPWAAFPAATAVEWSSETTGAAGDVDVTIAGLDELEPVYLDFLHLSDSAFAAAPFYSLTSALEYPAGATWTVTFSQPVATLLLYMRFWRGSGGGVDPVTYHFDLPFSIRSGLEAASVVGNAGGLTLSLPATDFHDGIVQIHGPLTSLTVTPNTDAGAAQLMAMALAPMPSARPVDWATPTSGSAGAIEITIAGLAASMLEVGDLSGADFAAAPLSASEPVLSAEAGADWTATFSEPAPGVLLYARFWRGNAAGVDPVTYRFDVPFTILSGLGAASISEDGTLLTLPADGFHDGILFFPGPLETLAVESNSTTQSFQDLTFAVVPEPGATGAALAAWLALLGLGRAFAPERRLRGIDRQSGRSISRRAARRPEPSIPPRSGRRSTVPGSACSRT